VAVGKILAVECFLAGRDCQILQIETQKRNAFTLSFLSRRDLQILLVEPAKNPRLPNFGDQHTWVIIDGFYYRGRYKVLCEWSGFVAFSWSKNGAPGCN
jgi:hypothetical protein